MSIQQQQKDQLESVEKTNNFTEEQARAIEGRNNNFLVSAGAGSGKTFVMVERIKKLITEENVSVDELLVVTFTNASAAEMKERISKAIVTAIEEEPSKRHFLQEQLLGLSDAHISTFHSFAQRVIQKFYYTIGVEPGLKVCDESRATLIIEQVLDDLIEEWLGNQYADDFINFLNCYGNERSFSTLKNNLISAYHQLRSMPNPMEWLEEQKSQLSGFEHTWETTAACKWLEEYCKEQVLKAVSYRQRAYQLVEEQGLDNLAAKFYEEIQRVEGMLNLDLAELEEGLNSGSYKVTLRAGKDEKEIWNEIKDLVSIYRDESDGILKKLKTRFFSTPLKEQAKDVERQAALLDTFCSLMKTLDSRYLAAKQQQGLMDFGDMEHFAIEILKHQEASDYYKNKFKHIFIDEYQDTNAVQEKIISLVRRESNLFMVGDVKQCIYQFRQADPSIFAEKQRLYNLHGNETYGCVINLNTNFRSKPAILDFVNSVFNGPMKEFDENAILEAHNQCPDECYAEPLIYDVDEKEVKKLMEELPSLAEADELDATNEVGLQEDVSYLEELKKAEIEAIAVAKLIKEQIGTPIYNNGVIRPVDYKDIVVLMRSVKSSVGAYNWVFKQLGVPVFLQEDEGYLDAFEVSVITDLLAFLDNNRRDKELICVLHSPLFDFSSKELTQIRLMANEGACSYYDAFIHCAKLYEGGEHIWADPFEEMVAKKASEAFETLQCWRAKAQVQDLDKVIWDIMTESGYYLAVGALPMGMQRQANLRLLLEIAGEFQQAGSGGLFQFVNYIKALKEKKIDRGPVSLMGEGDNVVRLMTIHKSKGLEFPVVILAGLDRKLNYSKADSFVTIERNIGLGLMLAGPLKYWKKNSLIQNISLAKKLSDEEAENWRVLYVAMTRAKDKLLMVNVVTNKKKHQMELQAKLPKMTSYNAMLTASSINRENLEITLDDIPASSIETGKLKSFYDAKAEDGYQDKVSADLENNILMRLNYKYKNWQNADKRLKYTVTQLNKEYGYFMSDRKLVDFETGENYLKTKEGYVPKFLAGDVAMSAAQKGTSFHRIMYLLNFDECYESLKTGGKCGLGVKEQIALMLESGLISQEEADEINEDEIQGFFKTCIGTSIGVEKGQLIKEQAFTLAMEKDGDEILVQGIIDGYCILENRVLLWDYKTNYISPDMNDEEIANKFGAMYFTQMEVYGKALEEALGIPIEKSYLYMSKKSKLLEIDLTKYGNWKII